MPTKRPISPALALLVFALLTVLPISRAANPSEKWAPDIARLTAHDATQPPPPGAVVFVGSSSIVKWTTLAADFPELKVINRGFGGSELADSVFFADRIVLPYHPTVVVLYAGENDIANGKSPETVRRDFKAFCAKVRAAQPDVPIVYVGIKPSPVREKYFPGFRQANALIAAECAKLSNCTFVDVWSAMLTPAAKPRPDLFGPDQLHMNRTGYAIWRAKLAPILDAKAKGRKHEP